jgi:hypothetical protein
VSNLAEVNEPVIKFPEVSYLWTPLASAIKRFEPDTARPRGNARLGIKPIWDVPPDVEYLSTDPKNAPPPFNTYKSLPETLSRFGLPGVNSAGFIVVPSRLYSPIDPCIVCGVPKILVTKI